MQNQMKKLRSLKHQNGRIAKDSKISRAQLWTQPVILLLENEMKMQIFLFVFPLLKIIVPDHAINSQAL